MKNLVNTMLVALGISALASNIAVITAQLVLGVPFPWYSVAHHVTTTILWLIITTQTIIEIAKES